MESIENFEHNAVCECLKNVVKRQKRLLTALLFNAATFNRFALLFDDILLSR